MSTSTEQVHHTRVVAGYKATLTNPRTSEAAKRHAREQLEALERYTDDQQKDEHNHRVLGGFKATLSNPNTSGEAKKHAREVLEAAGIDFSGNIENGQETYTDAHNMTRVLAGYKATLHNPNTSEEAKAHARQVLERENAL